MSATRTLRHLARRLSRKPSSIDLAIRPIIEALEERQLFASIVVTGTGDTINASDGVVTLREAVTAANNNVNSSDVIATGTYGADVITFNIAGPGPHTIDLGSALPDLVGNLTFDNDSPSAENITIDGNSAGFRLFSLDAADTLTLTGLNIAEFDTGGFGGALSSGGALTIINSTFSFNGSIGEDSFGGAVYASGGSLTVIGSTFAENHVEGLDNIAAGGAIYAVNTTVKIWNTTISDNTADGFVIGATGLQVHTGSTLELYNTVVSGNPAGTDLVVDPSVTQTTGSNYIGGDAKLAAIADNGGRVQTMKPAADSPLIGAGDNTKIGDDLSDADADASTTEDQPYDSRGPGFIRRAGTVDIGSFEIQPDLESLVVTTLVDEDDGTSDKDFGAGTSLREAMNYARSQATQNTVTFDPTLFATHKTISLTLGELVVGVGDSVIAPTIGVTVTRDAAASNFRIFRVEAAPPPPPEEEDPPPVAVSQMKNLTISNGVALNGGGIWVQGGLVLDRSVITGNKADDGDGGGISVTGSLSMTNSVVSDNDAAGFGGGVGGIGSIEIYNSLITGNSAQFNGGGVSGQGSLRLTNVTITQNDAGAAAGGVEVDGGATIINSTIVDNTAGELNPGVFVNVAGVLTLNNTIISDADTGQDLVNTGTLSGSNNFIGDGDDSDIEDLTDTVSGDPKLNALAENGGPTKTMSLQKGSTALNAGNNAALPTDSADLDGNLNVSEILPVDGRGVGFARTSGWSVDIGAYEYLVVESLVVTTTEDEFDNTSDPTFGTGTSLREALAFAFVNPGPETITFDLDGDGPHTITLNESLLPLSEVSIDNSSPDAEPITITRDESDDAFPLFFLFRSEDSLQLSGLTFTNGATGNGGAAFVFNASLTLIDCTVSGNTATGETAGGGAVFVLDGNLTVIGTTFSENSVTATEGDGGGAAIAAHNSNVTLINSTLSGNTVSATDEVFGYGVLVTGTGSLVINNTVIAGNVTADNQLAVGASITQSGSNNFIGGDPKLGDLADNGGLVFTMKPEVDSPLLNAGSNTAIAADATDTDGDADLTEQQPFDARGSGFSRIIGGTVDIGAFESPNVAPTADAGGPYNVVEGASVQLDGSGSSDEQTASADLNYAWDLDGDGVFGETGAGALRGNETGATPTFNTGTLDGAQAITVKLKVTDTAGLTSSEASATINLANKPPTASAIGGPGDLNRNVVGTFTFGATEPSAADRAAGLSYAINWGDGTSTHFTGGLSPSRNHAYANVGVYTISYTVTDKDGGVSEAVTKIVTVAGSNVVTDPSDPTKTALIVGGTTGNDTILIDKSGSGLKVTMNGVNLGTFNFTGALFVLGQDGNDTITVAGTITSDVFLYGGTGADKIISGNGRAVVVGGDGADTLTAGNGRDVLIGGNGADSINGGNGEDLLVAGRTSWDVFSSANATKLRQLRDEWANTTRTYTQRINRLLGTTAGSPVVLKAAAGAGQNVFSDSAIDKLTGGNENDWFIGNVLGTGVLDTLDKAAAETATDQ